MEQGTETEPINLTTTTKAKSGKIDVAWNYFEDQTKEGGRKLFKCLFCGNTYKGGGINRMKQHLAGVPREIVKCPKVSHHVRVKMLAIIQESKEKREDNKKAAATIRINFSENRNNEDVHHASEVVKVATPVINLLRIVDSDERPTLGYMYEGMSEVVQRIKLIYNDIEAMYKPYIDITNKRWNKHFR
ncbi:hypothetical protein LINGRAHAP2_LOCUS22949, partial [Linum grandiflorum]